MRDMQTTSKKRLTLLRGGLTDAFWEDHAAFLLCVKGGWKARKNASICILNALYGNDGGEGARPIVCAYGLSEKKTRGLVVLTKKDNEAAVRRILTREDVSGLNLSVRHRLSPSDAEAYDFRGVLINALTKERFLPDLTIKDAVFSKGFAVRFINEKDRLESVLDFRCAGGGLVNFADYSHNLRLADPEHAKEYMFCYDQNSCLGFVLGKADKPLPRYTYRRQNEDIRKNAQVLFQTGSNADEEKQNRFYQKGGIAGLKNMVLKRLNESGYVRLTPVVVDTHTVSFTIATRGRKNEAQKKRAALEQAVRRDRARREGLDVGMTSHVSDFARQDLVGAVLNVTEPRYLIRLKQGKGKADVCGKSVVILDRDRRIRDVLGVCGSHTYRLQPLDGETHGWQTYIKRDGNPSETKTLLVYPESPLTMDELIRSISIRDEDEGRDVPLAENGSAEALEIRAVTEKDDPYIGIPVTLDGSVCRHHLIVQEGMNDPDYCPGYDKQYIKQDAVTCEPGVLRYESVLAAVRKCLTELLMTKADLMDKSLRSFPGGRGWTCVCRYVRSIPKKSDKKTDNEAPAGDPDDAELDEAAGEKQEIVCVQMTADQNGGISFSETNDDRLMFDFESCFDLIDRRKFAVFIESPGLDRKQMAMQISDIGTLLSDGGELSAYRHSLTDPGIFADGLRANTGYRYFSYNGGLYYETGWDASDGLRPSYSSLPAIYRMFAPGGMTETDWETFFTLCDVGFVSSASDSTVYPAFVKYIREYRNKTRDPKTTNASTFSRKQKD